MSTAEKMRATRMTAEQIALLVGGFNETVALAQGSIEFMEGRPFEIEGLIDDNCIVIGMPDPGRGLYFRYLLELDAPILSAIPLVKLVLIDELISETREEARDIAHDAERAPAKRPPSLTRRANEIAQTLKAVWESMGYPILPLDEKRVVLGFYVVHHLREDLDD